VGRDPEYLAFMRRVAQARADAGEQTVEAEREAYARSAAQAPRAPMAAVEDLAVPGGDRALRGRLLTPPDATDDLLVYVHGGGWYLGDLDSCEPVARVIAQATGCRVLEIEHRQAPEHPFPAPLDDVIATLRWALVQRGPLRAGGIGAVGDSSGGNLVAAAARHVDGLALQALIYPALDLSRPPDPLDDPDGIEMPRALQATADRYTAGADPSDPDVSPLHATDLAGLPPTVICTAQYDPLRPQGLAYAERLRAAGVPVRLVDAHGLDHAFFAWGAYARRPAQAIAEFGDAVRAAINEKRHGPEPPGVLSAT
jgi:acetyl esterase